MTAVWVFDAYGTLFDVHSAVARHAGGLGGRAAAVSELWRVKQLEYSWVLTLAGRHADFWAVTGDALDFALAAHGVRDSGLRSGLMDAYRTLDAYPDVTPALRALRVGGARTAILSNGSPEMLADAVAAAGVGALLDAVLSVEPAGVYKPAASVYALATARFGVAAGDVRFVSSNAWDVMGARTVGFQACWVNRAGRPDEYGLAGTVPVVGSLADLPGTLAAV